MIDITYKKKGIRITQIWFPEFVTKELENKRTDIVFVHGVKQRQKDKGYYQVFHTLVNCLQKEEDELFSKIHKNVRYEIRRNQKEEVSYKMFSPTEIIEHDMILEEFAYLYRKMYEEKGIKSILNQEQMQLYAKKGGLFISAIMIENKPVVMHSYIVDERKVRLLHSASEFRKEGVDANFIARCNKRLHWEDMCYFRKEEKEEYDWGGVSSLENPNGIDAFKFKFGGEATTYYNEYLSGSLLGKVIVGVLRLKNRKIG